VTNFIGGLWRPAVTSLLNPNDAARGEHDPERNSQPRSGYRDAPWRSIEPFWTACLLAAWPGRGSAIPGRHGHR
jgi:hypothetical protein